MTAAARAHVLMVDDEPSTLELVRLILEEEGYRVTTAETGEIALEKFTAEPTHVVITDLHLPGISGEELIPRLRQLAPQVPVLVLTAYGTIESAVEMIKGGACGRGLCGMG